MNDRKMLLINDRYADGVDVAYQTNDGEVEESFYDSFTFGEDCMKAVTYSVKGDVVDTFSYTDYAMMFCTEQDIYDKMVRELMEVKG